MAKYKDPETGEEVEAFSQEELDAKIKEEATRIENESAAKLTEKDSAIAAAQAERDTAKKALEDAGKGGDNYKTLKAALDAKDEKLKGMQGEVDSIKNQRVEDLKSAMITQIAGKDDDLKKKIEHHFSTTLKGVAANTPEEIKSKLENARKLSLDLDAPGAFDHIQQGGGPGMHQENDGKGLEFSSREKNLGDKLGIDDADRKKYATDPRLKSMIGKK